MHYRLLCGGVGGGKKLHLLYPSEALVSGNLGAGGPQAEPRAHGGCVSSSSG